MAAQRAWRQPASRESGESRRGTLLLVLFVAALAVVGVSVHRYVTLKREFTQTALARHATICVLAATTLGEKLERLVDVGTALATRVRFQELVAAGRWAEAGQILRRVPADFDFLDRIFLTDVHGTLMADVPEVAAVRGSNFSQRDWYQGVSREWKPYVSTLYRRAAAPQRNVVAIAVPIRNPAAEVAGILVLQIRIETFFEWARRIEIGSEGRVLIVDRHWHTAFDSRAPSDAQLATLQVDPLVARFGARASSAQLVQDGDAQYVLGHAPGAHGWGVVTIRPAAAAFAARDALLRQLLVDGAVIAAFAIVAAGFGAMLVAQRRRAAAERAHREELERSAGKIARQAERLRLVNEIDRAIIAETEPQAIAAAVIGRLREMLGVPRAIVNVFDLGAGEAEWMAAAGRRRVHVGPGVRYPIRLMGDLEGLRRGEPQATDTAALPEGAEKQALLEAGVRHYLAVPMIAGGELIGAISFGGESAAFSEEQVSIAREVADQLAIAIRHAQLYAQVRRHAEELEHRVRERTAELETANRDLESFSYSVSHDLRAPLRAIDGYGRMLEEDHAAALDDEGRRLLAVVRSRAAQMGQLIDDLLEFSQLGRKALAVAPVDMRALAAEVAEELAPAFPGAQLALGGLPAALGDRALLKHVWSNLLGNALKYSARAADPRVEVSGRTEGEENVYCVQDNGAGFDMRYYDKLFKVFQRLHGAEQFEGTGVGLAIAQRVLARHGGRIWAESSIGAGARFRFALPRKGPGNGKL